MRALRFFIRTMDWVSDRLGLMLSVLLPTMVLILTYEVVARYFFKNPTVWAYDMAIFMFGYTGLLCGAHVLRRKEHISVDLVYERLSPRKRAILDSITSLLFFFFIVLVIIYSSKTAFFALKMGQKTATEWAPPVSHFKFMIPVGGFLLLLQGFANWIRSLYRAITDKELEV